MSKLFGVGFGGSWTRQWRNEHFTSLDDAWIFAGQKLQETQAEGDKQRIKFHVESRKFDGQERYEIRLTNIKKDGTFGKWEFSVQVYEFETPCRSAFCNACRSTEKGALR